MLFRSEQFLKWGQRKERYIGLERGWIGGKIAVKRLDKVAWTDDTEKYPEFYDCHLPRPYSQNAEKINRLYKKLKLKDLKKESNTHVLIQAKWKDKAEPISSTNHFIKCCNEIKDMKKIESDDISTTTSD